MLKIIKGDILQATEDIICHQCNTEGIFGGGLALQIKQLYPQCEKQTMDWLKDNEDFMGDYYLYINKQDTKIIANCFTQNEDFTTNYEMVKKCFTKLKENCKDTKQSIAIPFRYGSGIATGNFTKILEILLDIFDDLTIYYFTK